MVKIRPPQAKKKFLGVPIIVIFYANLLHFFLAAAQIFFYANLLHTFLGAPESVRFFFLFLLHLAHGVEIFF